MISAVSCSFIAPGQDGGIASAKYAFMETRGKVVIRSTWRSECPGLDLEGGFDHLDLFASIYY